MAQGEVHFSQFPLEFQEKWALALAAEERERLIGTLTPGSCEHVQCLSLLSEQQGFPDKLEQLLAAVEPDMAKVRATQQLAILKRHRVRRALLSASKAEAAAELSEVCGASTGHSRVTRTSATAAATAAAAAASAAEAAAPSALASPQLQAALDTLSLVKDARPTFLSTQPSIVERIGWIVSSLRPTSGVIELPAVRALLEDAAPNKLGLRWAILEQGLPLTVDPVTLVETIMASLVKDRTERVPADVLRSSRGVLGFIRRAISRTGAEDADGDSNISPNSHRYYADMTLDELQRLRSRGRVVDLENDLSWVQAVVARLAPHEGTRLDDSDPAAEDAYISAVMGFALTLPVQWNDLRGWAHGMRLRLAMQRHGTAAAAPDALKALLQMPGYHSFGNSGPSGGELSSYGAVVDSASPGLVTDLPVLMKPLPKRELGSLIDDAIQRGLGNDAYAEAGRAVRRHLHKSHIPGMEARSRLLEGEVSIKWTSAFDANSLEALRKQTTLAFVQPRERFSVHDAVTIRLHVKNVPRLTVSLFELNTTAIFRETGADVQTDMELAGLVPAVVETIALERSPFHQAAEEIALPALAEPRRGVWIMEAIGGGLRARCIIRKGALRVVSAATAAGHSFRVLDENNRPVPADRASIWMDGTEFRCEAVEHPTAFKTAAARDSDAGSQIIIPYTGAAPSSKSIVVTLSPAAPKPVAGEGGASAAVAAAAGGPAVARGPSDWPFSSLLSFKHERGDVSLECGWVLDDQALVRDNHSATVLVRPRLYLTGSEGLLSPLPLAMAQSATVTVVSTDVEGTEATRVWRDVKLSSSEELTLTFAVPNRLSSLQFSLECVVESAHSGAKRTLRSSHRTQVNQAEQTSNTCAIFLHRSSRGYGLYVLGKAGEPVAGERLSIALLNAVNTRERNFSATTDAAGRVLLGQLENVVSLQASGSKPSTPRACFVLGPDSSDLAPSHLWSVSGAAEQCVIPHSLAPGESGVGRARLVSLRPALSGVPASPVLRHVAPGSIQRDNLTASNLSFDSTRGCLVVRGLPAGRYALIRRGADCRDARVVAIAINIQPRAGSDHAAGAAGAAAAAAAARGRGSATHLSADKAGQADLGLLADAGRFFATAPSLPAVITGTSFDRASLALAVHVHGGAPPTAGSDGARVHVWVRHLEARAGAGALTAGMAKVGVMASRRRVFSSSKPAKSQYLRNVALGEEESYVVDRQSRELALPGNSLPRPSLLLTPWMQRTTKSDEIEARKGEALEKQAELAEDMPRRQLESVLLRSECLADLEDDARELSRLSSTMRFKAKKRAVSANVDRAKPGFSSPDPCTPTAEPGWDFLGAPGHCIANVRPGTDGVATVSLAEAFDAFGQPHVREAFWAAGLVATVVYCDGFTSSVRQVLLGGEELEGSGVPSTAAGCAAASTDGSDSGAAALDVSGAGPLRRCYRNLTLQEPLDTTKHFVQSKAAVALQAGESTTLTAASDTQAEEFGTVSKALQLMATLSGDGRVLGEFSWLGRWHATDEPERRRLYSKYACHEVNLFLYFKDRAWFDAVVAPFVACKRSKTFIDHFLLGHDLSEYAKPPRFRLLNALERALLAGREGASKLVAHSHDRASVRKPSAAARERIFQAALASSGLEEPEVPLVLGLCADQAPMACDGAASFGSGFGGQRNKVSAAHRSAERRCLAEEAEDSDEDDEDLYCASSEEELQMECQDVMEGQGPADDGLWLSQTDEVDAATRRRRQLFRAVDKTEELAETHYWRVRAGRGLDSSLIPDSPFWADFAAHQSRSDGAPFLSTHFAAEVGNINTVLAAIAVLGLGFDMPVPSRVTTVGSQTTWLAREAPLVLFKVDISEAEAPAAARVLVGQNFFDPQDRSRTEADGSVTEKYLETGEFLRNKVYGAQVVVTNVSSSSRDLRVLLQIPQGALPVRSGFVTRTLDVRLSAYETRTLEFSFYFPFLGAFRMFPAHVSAGEALEAHAAPAELRVVTALTVVDKTSWEYIANESPLEECIAYLSTSNLQVNGVRLSDVAWRCAEEPAYKAITAALRARCEWDAAVFGYAFKHKDPQGMAEYAGHPSGGLPSVAKVAGPRLSSALVNFAPELGVPMVDGQVAHVSGQELNLHPSLHDGDKSASGMYEHLEYAPLINSRAHRLGEERRIANTAVAAQYRRLLATLMHAPAASVTAAERLALVYHLLLQDRVEEAQRHFALVQAPAGCAAVGGSGDGSGAAAAAAAGAGGSAPSAGSASWCALAYDYMAAYIDFFAPEGGLAVARRVAEAYAAYPVPRWAAKFAAVRSQLAELDLAEEEAASGSGSRAGKAGQSSSKGGTAPGERDEDLGSELLREAQQAGAAGGEPTLDMELTKGAGSDASLRIVAANVQSVELRYYCMDVELLFSTKPFTSAGAGSGGKTALGFVRPNKSVTVPLPAVGGGSARELDVAVDASVGPNLLIEAVAGGKRASATFFACSLDVEVMHSAGRVRVTDRATGRPVHSAYVKVFGSSTEGGSDSDAFFFKDCYTSATGVADYASLSTDALDRVRKLAVLVSAPGHGAVSVVASKPAT
ncbi:hypothetical protein FNF29_04713 [Cafeteria roenbergensis]|uniref:Uncharacterized protein n=1 Tax=Cafeteria roenbergensis TaxID=33653 RepID=A0A5A8CEA6_CAFRO|nr:hypothetical protein FNF29_04713 [Cafeteria roenbergensis]|eukprot:KAA0151238.1 hypothetical protein FNF29_04713 [Cafeteria roenbergensis]